MGNRGRFGKYGDIKRVDRLRRARMGTHLSNGKKRINFFQNRKSSYQGLPQDLAVSVRLAHGSEIYFIKGLSRKLFNLYGPYDEIIPKWFESDITITFITLVNGQPVGFAMIGKPLYEYDFQHAAELLAIALESKHQGRGIAKLLLRELEREARKRGLKRIYLHTATNNLSAQRLFTCMDYRMSGIKKSFYPEGQNALVMYKELSEVLLK